MSETIKQTLYLKYRPKSFSELIGQEHISKTLQNAVTLGRISHAYLFSGPRGTGKTSTARLFAKLVNCKSPIKLSNQFLDVCRTCDNCLKIEESKFLDIIEVDAASNNSVEDIRQMREKVKFLPVEGKYKVYIIDEVHMLSTSAFNAFLKTLEEPPPNVIFILATTELHKVPATIVSRCQCFEFKPIPKAKLVNRLKEIVDSEHSLAPNKFPSIDMEALHLIAEEAEGGFRDALSLLDQVTSYSSSSTVSHELILEITKRLGFTTLHQLFAGVFNKEPKLVLETLYSIYNSGYEPIYICKNILNYLHYCIHIKSSDNLSQLLHLPKEIISKISEQIKNISLEFLVSIASVLERSFSNIKHSLAPQILLEIELLKITNADSNLNYTITPTHHAHNKDLNTTLANINYADFKNTPSHDTTSLASVQAKPTSKTTTSNSALTNKDYSIMFKNLIPEISKSHKILGALLQQTNFVSYTNCILTIKPLHSFLVPKLNESKNQEVLRSFFEKEIGKLEKIVILNPEPDKPEKKTTSNKLVSTAQDQHYSANSSDDRFTKNINLLDEISKIEQSYKNDILKKPEVVEALEIFGGKVLKVEQ